MNTQEIINFFTLTLCNNNMLFITCVLSLHWIQLPIEQKTTCIIKQECRDLGAEVKGDSLSGYFLLNAASQKERQAETGISHIPVSGCIAGVASRILASITMGMLFKDCGLLQRDGIHLSNRGNENFVNRLTKLFKWL